MAETVRLARAVLELATDSKGFFADVEKAEATAKGLEDAFSRSGKTFGAFGGIAKSVGSAMTVGLTLPIAGIGAAAVKMATDLN